MVHINDKYYIWASNDKIVEKAECGGAVTSILKFLLDENLVDGVLGISKGSDVFDALPLLIENPEDVIKLAGSLHTGTQNIVKIVEKYLSHENYRLAVPTKPCESMTFLELIKRGQIKRENIIMLGLNCGGTLPPVKSRDCIREVFKLDPDSIDSIDISSGKLVVENNYSEKQINIDELENEGFGRRSNCKRCDMNIPQNSDLGFGNWGVENQYTGKVTFVEVFSEKGAEILKKAMASGVIQSKKPSKSEVEKRSHVDNHMIKLARKWQFNDFKDASGLLELIHIYHDQFKKCIKCFGCREACPICYCEECSLESNSPQWLEKGQIPPSPLFHLERLIHMAESCVNCGQCEDVCPMEIPLSAISHEINTQIEEIFHYYPGIDYKKPPMSHFSPYIP